jgi:exosome complex component RRP42
VIGEGEEMEIEVSDNPFDYTSINTDNVPIIVTLSSIGGHFVVDASHEEEACSTCQVSVAINEKDGICGMTKEGKGGISLRKYSQIVPLAVEVSKLLLEKMNCKITTNNSLMI